MPSFTHDDAFPVVERLIAAIYQQDKDFVTHGSLVKTVMEDAIGKRLIADAARQSSTNWSKANWASNMIAWFSKEASTRRPDVLDRFDRIRILGRYAYKPKGSDCLSARSSTITTIFTFGYDGWGSATPKLVQAVDAIERDRGFEPPMFVDTRLHRAVRAEGFRERNFENLLHDSRHLHLPKLGNLGIASKVGPAIQIADPWAANDLLNVALKSSNQNRRVIFFCSCKWPYGNVAGRCHRSEIARLLLRVSTDRNVPIEVVEWPGGSPVEIELHFGTLRDKSILLGKRLPSAELLGLPWGSLVLLGETRVVSGPAQFRSGAWQLPVLSSFSKAEKTKATQRAGRLRTSHGLNKSEKRTAVSAPKHN